MYNLHFGTFHSFTFPKIIYTFIAYWTANIRQVFRDKECAAIAEWTGHAGFFTHILHFLNGHIHCMGNIPSKLLGSLNSHFVKLIGVEFLLQGNTVFTFAKPSEKYLEKLREMNVAELVFSA